MVPKANLSIPAPQPSNRSSTASWTSISRANQQSPFLKLPAEIRNIIYHYVFYPTVDPDCLIPSSTDLSSLSFLHTCRQVHHEAHLLAYSVTFSITNRWHRCDLLDMYSHFQSQPHNIHYPIKELELASQWRQPYRPLDALGMIGPQFLDSFHDYGNFVWDCVEIFKGLERIVVNTEYKVELFARRLSYVMKLEGENRAWIGAVSRHQEADNWLVVIDMKADWGCPQSDPGPDSFNIVGRGKKAGRTVVVQGKPIEKENIVDAISVRTNQWDPAVREFLHGLRLL